MNFMGGAMAYQYAKPFEGLVALVGQNLDEGAAGERMAG